MSPSQNQSIKPGPLFVSVVILATLVGVILYPVALQAQSLTVFVSIMPQQYFAEHIGGSHIQVQVMVPPAASPHTYEPKPRQMADLAKADVYYAIGVPFEQAWLPKIAAINPQMMVVHTDDGIDKLTLVESDDHLPQNNPMEQRHVDGGVDPHIWLSPLLVMIQAQHMRDALITVDPNHSADYRRNYQNFIAELQTLNNELSNALAPFKGARFMVFHPTWGYFAKTYGLVQIPIEVEGKTPKPAQLQTVINQAKEIGIKAILVQPQFSTKSAEIIARALDGRIIAVDPLSADWNANLRQLSQQLQAILK